jgi:hypothetical protein
MTKQTLEKYLSLVWETAVDSAKEEEVLPTLFVYTAQDQLIIYPMPWSDKSERYFYLSLARALLRAVQCTHYVVVSEAWGAIYNGKKKEDDPSPSQREDKTEILVAVAVSSTGEKLGYTAEITNHAGKREIGEIEMSDNMDGDLTTLFSEGFNQPTH